LAMVQRIAKQGDKSSGCGRRETIGSDTKSINRRWVWMRDEKQRSWGTKISEFKREGERCKDAVRGPQSGEKHIHATEQCGGHNESTRKEKNASIIFVGGGRPKKSGGPKGRPGYGGKRTPL